MLRKSMRADRATSVRMQQLRRADIFDAESLLVIATITSRSNGSGKLCLEAVTAKLRLSNALG